MATTENQATDEALREELTTWLRENLPDGWMDAIDRGDEDAFAAVAARADRADLIRRIGEAGWAFPTWEVDHGGRGLDADRAEVVEELKDHYRVPRAFNLLGFGLAAPTIREWGTEEQQRFFLRGLAQGEVWCQLFSEPGNGSDVAGLATQAVLDGDEWVVNGQKVWTSGAHAAKWGMLIARTDPEQPKHKGITYFAVDMHSPGVEVRPLRQMTGDAEFNEVFLSDVRIPDAWRIGPRGEGWSVAQTTLMNERVALSGAFGSGGARRRGGGGGQGQGQQRQRGRGGVEELVRRARGRGVWDDGAWRERVVRTLVDGRVAGYNAARTAAKRRTGQPGPEGSIGKLFQTEYNQRTQSLSVDVSGADAMAWDPDDQGAALRVRGFLRSRGNTIEGGTSEIQRNILGDRVLGLPREPDVSKDAPWKDVPRN